MDLIRRSFRAEPVAILTVVLIVVQAVLEAADGGVLTWEMAGRAAVTALAGLIARQSVYAPDTVGQRDARIAELEGELAGP